MVFFTRYIEDRTLVEHSKNNKAFVEISFSFNEENFYKGFCDK